MQQVQVVSETLIKPQNLLLDQNRTQRISQSRIQIMIKQNLQKAQSDPVFQLKQIKQSMIMEATKIKYVPVKHSPNQHMVNSYRVLAGTALSKQLSLSFQFKQQGQNLSRSSGRMRIKTPLKSNEHSIMNQSTTRKEVDLKKTQQTYSSQRLKRRPKENPVINYSSAPNLGKVQNPPPQILGDTKLYKIEQSRSSQKKSGLIRSYAANTHNGLFRNYNEDRVSIILSISKPAYKTTPVWPKCSFFAVYDGHGGSDAANFLRDNLHLYIIKEPTFPEQPEIAIKKGVEKADQVFLAFAAESGDRSGSCATVVMLIDDICYTANVGDSRVIISINRKGIQVTRDHKPQDELEQRRIEAAGGYIYQQSVGAYGNNFFFQGVKYQTPHRVFPGKLSVCRTFGDIQAKQVKYGGNPDVVICDAEITKFQITDEHDYIFLASDGIFDRLTTTQVNSIIWASHTPEADNIHRFSAQAVEQVFFQAFEQKTLDNITAVLIGLKGMKKMFSKKLQHEGNQQDETKLEPVLPSEVEIQPKLMKESTFSNNKMMEFRRKRRQESGDSIQNTL